MRRRRTGLRRIGIYALGWACLALGVAGLFLPILQGVLFLMIGISILASVSPLARWLRMRLRGRFPQMARQFDQAQRRAREILGNAQTCLGKWFAKR